MCIALGWKDKNTNVFHQVIISKTMRTLTCRVSTTANIWKRINDLGDMVAKVFTLYLHFKNWTQCLLGLWLYVRQAGDTLNQLMGLCLQHFLSFSPPYASFSLAL